MYQFITTAKKDNLATISVPFCVLLLALIPFSSDAFSFSKIIYSNLSSWHFFGGYGVSMDFQQMFIEYILVYCTSTGLTAIGEPALATPPDALDALDPSTLLKDPMPGWIICTFILLASSKWFLCFLVDYIYLVISSVIIVASTPIRHFHAANAKTHESSQRAGLEKLVQKIRVVGAFQTARRDRIDRLQRQDTTSSSDKSTQSQDTKSHRVGRLSVSDVRTDLKGRDTLKAAATSKISKSNDEHAKPQDPQTPCAPPNRKRAHPVPGSRRLQRTGPLATAWRTLTSLPCFRGFHSLLAISISQWLFAFIFDFLLSGHPEGLKLGYGTTSLILQTVYASTYAVWTHYTLTKPTQKRVFDHFPKGGDVLTELWPITLSWAAAEHICLSAPLALSRFWGLKKYAFHPSAWNDLSPSDFYLTLAQFATLACLYAALTALVALPVTILTRRVYASMLSEEDLAIVPFNRGSHASSHSVDRRAEFRKPGLTVGKAWETLSRADYGRALGVWSQGFLVKQAVQLLYWGVNWWLQGYLGVGQYRAAKLPWGNLGVLKVLGERGMPVVEVRGSCDGHGAMVSDGYLATYGNGWGNGYKRLGPSSALAFGWGDSECQK